MSTTRRQSKGRLFAGLESVSSRKKSVKTKKESFTSQQQKSLNNIIKLKTCMLERKVPPDWVINAFKSDKQLFEDVMQEAKVFYSSNFTNEEEIQQLLYRRTPGANLNQRDVDMDRDKLFDSAGFFKCFGKWEYVNEYDALCRRKNLVPQPNISVYTPVLLQDQDNKMFKAHVINISAFESPLTDEKYFQSLDEQVYEQVITRLYHSVYYRIYHCANMLGLNHVFCPILNIFKGDDNMALSAFMDVMKYASQKFNVSTHMVLSEDPQDATVFALMLRCHPNLKDVTKTDILKSTLTKAFLLVNDWNAFTVPGNGRTGLNGQTNNLDYFIGQNSSISVTSTSLTNPYIMNALHSTVEWKPEEHASKCSKLPPNVRKTKELEVIKSEIKMQTYDTSPTATKSRIEKLGLLGIQGELDVTSILLKMNDQKLTEIMKSVQIWYNHYPVDPSISLKMVHDLATVVTVPEENVKTRDENINSLRKIPLSVSQMLSEQFDNKYQLDEMPICIYSKSINNKNDTIRHLLCIQGYDLSSNVTTYFQNILRIIFKCAKQNSCTFISLPDFKPFIPHYEESNWMKIFIDILTQISKQYPDIKIDAIDIKEFQTNIIGDDSTVLYVLPQPRSQGKLFVDQQSSMWATTDRFVNHEPFSVFEIKFNELFDVASEGVKMETFGPESSKLAISGVQSLLEFDEVELQQDQTLQQYFAWGFKQAIYLHSEIFDETKVFQKKSNMTTLESINALFDIRKTSTCEYDAFKQRTNLLYPPTVRFMKVYTEETKANATEAVYSHVAFALTRNMNEGVNKFFTGYDEKTNAYISNFTNDVIDLIFCAAKQIRACEEIILEVLGSVKDEKFVEDQLRYIAKSLKSQQKIKQVIINVKSDRPIDRIAEGVLEKLVLENEEALSKLSNEKEKARAKMNIISNREFEPDNEKKYLFVLQWNGHAHDKMFKDSISVEETSTLWITSTSSTNPVNQIVVCD